MASFRSISNILAVLVLLTLQATDPALSQRLSGNLTCSTRGVFTNKVSRVYLDVSHNTCRGGPRGCQLQCSGGYGPLPYASFSVARDRFDGSCGCTCWTAPLTADQNFVAVTVEGDFQELFWDFNCNGVTNDGFDQLTLPGTLTAFNGCHLRGDFPGNHGDAVPASPPQLGLTACAAACGQMDGMDTFSLSVVNGQPFCLCWPERILNDGFVCTQNTNDRLFWDVHCQIADSDWNASMGPPEMEFAFDGTKTNYVPVASTCACPAASSSAVVRREVCDPVTVYDSVTVYESVTETVYLPMLAPTAQVNVPAPY
ncbi:hypothetical protein K432DRAFT_444168 [Lepidopterella palustris CBS 459.81]|uniref:Uncharacterized protein n=1 Tax=Lepidopterella palustris CBS 459.81 TaxID=1314670 RepID=A0A8E2JDX4_9PEZI|nr:hypothetical protein K432DRAFT_444168 [Lepidopterella palustris CBS 459.81]